MITPDNDVVQTGIINWPSHLCSFTGNGYTSGVPDGYRKVNSALYDLIPETDIRKQWFLSPDNKSSLIDNEQIEGTSIVEYFGLTPYVNTKFGAYQSIFGNTTNASDWPLMRVEEMYLIKAEAEAMGGNLSGGKSTLEILYGHIGILPLQVKLIRHRIFRMRFGCSVVWNFGEKVSHCSISYA